MYRQAVPVSWARDGKSSVFKLETRPDRDEVVPASRTKTALQGATSMAKREMTDRREKIQ